jgi:catechol 2,3-dioxygenase-like lactoylglutathione lyase family enzyme
MSAPASAAQPNFVILYVDNPKASGEFYAALLGRGPVEASPTFVMFALETGLMLGLWSRHGVKPVPSATGGGCEVGIAVDNPAAVDTTCAAWKARGVRIAQEPTAMDFGRTFVGLDPDGHRLRLFRAGAGRGCAEGGRTMSACWLAVASAEHVRRGRSEGFMQVGHGKAAPLRRIKPGDRVVYYSPTVKLGGKDKLQAFTAIGTVKDREAYVFDMGRGFRPYRRDVDWAKANEAPIAPLLDALAFAAGKPNWGYQLRFGLFAIGTADFCLIARAMGARLPGR